MIVTVTPNTGIDLTLLIPEFELNKTIRASQSALGMGGKGRILVVVYTYRKETIRVISAWKANAKQRRRYEKQFR